MKSSSALASAKTLARKLLVPVLLIAASFAFVAVNAQSHERMSPFDEYVYIDYLAKVPEQGLVHRGEVTGDLARQHYSCYGVEVFGKIAPDNCATAAYEVDAEYPFDGINSADIYTPAYFWITWAVAQPISWFSGTDLVESGRMAGGVWLAGAAVLLFYALGRLKLSRTARIATPLLMIASISAWWSNTYISTDASALLAGAGLLLLSLRYVQSGRGGWTLALASTLAVALKFQNFMAVALTVIFLLFHLIEQRSSAALPKLENPKASPPAPRNVWFTVSSMLLLPVFFQLSWMAVRSAIAVGGPPDQQTATPLGVNALVHEAFKFFGRVGNALPVNPEATVGWALSTIAAWLLIAGVLAAIAIEARWSTRYSLALAWLVTAIAAGPALAIATRVTEGYYFDLPVRYGISLLPLALGLAAMLFDRKLETRSAFAGLAGVTFLASFSPYYPGGQMFG